MSTTSIGAHAPGASVAQDAMKSIRGLQSLHRATEQRHVSVDTTQSYSERERMASTLSRGEERSLIDATKDIASNLFSAFRNELRGALSQIGISGEKAADIVREVGKSFVDAVRNGKSFSFGMIAAAYKETILQTGTSVSHSLEFSAKGLAIEYNNDTGELTVDTSEFELDAVKSFQSDNLPVEARALFDFTDGEGVPDIMTLFDKVQQYLTQNGFIEDGEDQLALPGLHDTGYDMVLVNDEESAPGENGGDDAGDGAGDDSGPNTLSPTSFGPLDQSKEMVFGTTIKSIENYTNGRMEKITRTTFDMVVHVVMDGKKSNPEVSAKQADTNLADTNRAVNVTA